MHRPLRPPTHLAVAMIDESGTYRLGPGGEYYLDRLMAAQRDEDQLPWSAYEEQQPYDARRAASAVASG